MTTTTTPATADLPDDPRDCCRAAIRILINSDFEDEWLDAKAIVAVATAATEAEIPVSGEAMGRLLHRAEDALAVVGAHMDRVGALVRHGARDYREMDKRLAERVKALEEGREPPHEPTGYEVRGAMIAAEAAGKPISEEEAIALLRSAQAPREAA